MTHSDLAFIFLAAPLLALSACSSSEAPPPPPFDDVDVTGRSANPEGVPYPSDDWGARPRDGATPGQRIPNFSFQGYPNSDRSKGLQVVSFADYYDPGNARYKLMYLIAAVTWCPHCQAETRAVVASSAALRDKGVVVVQTIMQGASRSRPLSLVDIDDWMAGMGTDFTILIDAEAKRLGTVADISGVPWNALIDPRSMEVLDVTIAQEDDPVAYVGPALQWAAANPPRQ